MCNLVVDQVIHKLSDEEFVIICTIHQEPNYRFTASERKAACKMVTIGLLVPVINDKYRFVVTKSGKALYSFFNLKVKMSVHRLPKNIQKHR